MESLDELDAVMAGFPFGPFSDIDIVPIVDLESSLQRTKDALQAMAQCGG